MRRKIVLATSIFENLVPARQNIFISMKFKTTVDNYGIGISMLE